MRRRHERCIARTCVEHSRDRAHRQREIVRSFEHDGNERNPRRQKRVCVFAERRLWNDTTRAHGDGGCDADDRRRSVRDDDRCGIDIVMCAERATQRRGIGFGIALEFGDIGCGGSELVEQHLRRSQGVEIRTEIDELVARHAVASCDGVEIAAVNRERGRGRHLSAHRIDARRTRVPP